MRVFRERLAASSKSTASSRRWVYVPYDQLTDAIGPLSRLPPAERGVVLVESTGKPARRPYHKQKLALLLASEQPVERLVLLSPYLRIRHRWFYGARPETYLRSLGRLITDVPRRPLSIHDPAMRAEAEKVVFFRTFSVPAVKSAMELIERVRSFYVNRGFFEVEDRKSVV